MNVIITNKNNNEHQPMKTGYNYFNVSPLHQPTILRDIKSENGYSHQYNPDVESKKNVKK